MSAFVMTFAGGTREVATYTVPRHAVAFARTAERTAGATQAIRVWGDGGALPAELAVTLFVQDDTAYVHVPGSFDNRLRTEARAALNITGDVDMRARVRLPSLTQHGPILSKSGYALYVNANGTVYAYMDLDPSGGASYYSTASLPSSILTTPLWVRATFDADNGASGHTVSFYTSADAVTWTALGTPVVTAGTVVLKATHAALVLVGGDEEMDVYAAEVYAGISGTLVAGFDARDVKHTGMSWVGGAGETWTTEADALDPLTLVRARALPDAYAFAYDIIADAEVTTGVSTHEGRYDVTGFTGYDLRLDGREVLLTLRFVATGPFPHHVVRAPSGRVTLAGNTATVEAISIAANAVLYGTNEVKYGTDAVVYGT